MGELRRPATKKQQSSLNSDDDKVARCSQCAGIVVNGDERHFSDDDVICACELPQHSDDFDAAVSYPNDDQLASGSTPY